MTVTWEDVAETVKHRRLELGLSQRAAAKAAGVSTTTWLSLEKYANPVNEHTQRGIARALEWQPDFIVRNRDGEIVAIVEAKSHTTPAGGQDYNSKIARLSPEAQAVIDTIIEAEERKQHS